MRSGLQEHPSQQEQFAKQTAGRTTNSSQIEQLRELFSVAMTTSERQAVLICGSPGSGKTRAAEFFCSREWLLSVTTPRVRDACAVHVSLSQNPEQAGQDFLKDVINGLGFENLRRTVRDLVVELGKEQSLHLIQESGAGETLGKAVWLMGLEPEQGQLVPFIGEPPRSAHGDLLKSYFLHGYRRAHRQNLRLSRGIDSNADRSRVLIALFSCQIGFAPIEQIERHTRVILWIDDVENAIYYPAASLNSFMSMIGDLVWFLPNYFTVIMNYSGWHAEDVMILLGEPDRCHFTHRIYFPFVTSEEYDTLNP